MLTQAIQTYAVLQLHFLGAKQVATTFYITAGLPAQDSAATQPTVTTFYITAGIPANDYVAEGTTVSVGKSDLTFSIKESTTLRDWTITAAKQDLTLSTKAPVITYDWTVDAGKQDLAFSIKAPTVTAWDIWADSYTINVGSLNSGSLADTRATDTSYLIFDEAVGVYPTGGFSIDFFFNDIPSNISTIYVDLVGYYAGNAAHNVKVQAYNYNNTTWENITVETDDLPSRSTDASYQWPINIANNVSSGQLRFRFLHTTNGSSGHTLNINKFFLSETYSATVEAEKQDLTFTIQPAVVAYDYAFAVGKQDLTLTIKEAAVSTIEDALVAADKQDLTFAVRSPVVLNDWLYASNNQNLAFTVLAATVSTVAEVTIAANKQDLTLSTKAASVLFDYVVSVNKQDLVFLINAATVSTQDAVNASVSVTTQQLTFSINGVTTTFDCVVVTTTTDLDFSINSSVVEIATVIIPADALDLTLSVNPVSFFITQVLQPSTQSLAFSIFPVVLSVAQVQGFLRIEVAWIRQPTMDVDVSQPTCAVGIQS
jgi:hypothetical protein